MEIDSLQLHEVIREHGEERHRPLPVISASQWIHYLSIDEMTTPTKGRTRVKQYNKDKPDKWGAKDFELCCAKTGYFTHIRGRMNRGPKVWDLPNLQSRVC